MKIRLLIGNLLLCSSFVSAQTTTLQEDLDRITVQINRFVEIINHKAYDEVDLIAAKELVPDIKRKMMGLRSYKLTRLASGNAIEELEPGKKMKLHFIYKEKRIWSKVKGFETYFIFEKKGAYWFMVETDFGKSVSLFGFPFWLIRLLLHLFFWLWMIVDCARYCTDNRVAWILFLLFFNMPAAMIYFFIVWRNRLKAPQAPTAIP